MWRWLPTGGTYRAFGAEIGPSAEYQRLLFQGLSGPHTVAEALKGAIFAARLFKKLGYEVSPAYNEQRHDIVQAIRLGSAEKCLLSAGACSLLPRLMPMCARGKQHAGL